MVPVVPTLLPRNLLVGQAAVLADVILSSPRWHESSNYTCQLGNYMSILHFMAAELTSEQAAAELARADRMAGRVQDRSRWMATYLGVFAAGFGAVTLIVGLVAPLWLRMTIFGVLWTCLVVGMVIWSRLQPAVPRAQCRRGAWGWVGTAVLYAAAVWIGTPGLFGQVVFWLPAAVLVATPLAVAAWREHRR